jgi:cystathionine gamma-synthase
LRFTKAQENAAALAKKLAGHSAVTNVRYPGFGAIISFEIAGDAAAAERVCDGASLIINATSLGGVETTWERRRRWQLESHSIPENLIRISVGCENVDDLWRDIDTALTKA